MGFKGKATNKGANGEGDYPKAPPGNHPACLVAIVDLGIQESARYQSSETQRVHKVFLCWELTECKVPDKPGNFLIGRDYRLSYHEKAALRLMMEGWRNKTYQDGEEIDVGAALGKKCLLNVKMKKNKDGSKEYPQIEGVSSAPRGLKISDPLNKPVAWEMGEDVTDLPAWIGDYFHYGQPIKDWVMDGGVPDDAGGEQPVGATAGQGRSAADEAPFGFAPFLPWLGGLLALGAGVLA